MIALLDGYLDETDPNGDEQQQYGTEHHRDDEGEGKDKWFAHVRTSISLLELAEPLVVCQSSDTGEGFAFEEFEAGSAAGGDVGDEVADAGLLDGGD